MTPVDHGTARLSSRAVGGSVGNAHMVRKGSDPSQWDGSHTVLQMGHRQSRWACAGGGAVGAEEDDEEEGHEISHGETTSRQVSFNLCNAILGSGVLGFPYCFRQCGLVLASLTLFGVVLATDVSLGFLLRAATLTGKFSYDTMAEAMLGRVGYRLVYVSVIVLQMGGLVGYLNILADVLSSVSGSMIPPGMEPSRFGVMTGITAFFFLPLGVAVKSEQSMGAVSTLSMGLILVFVLVVLSRFLFMPPGVDSGPLLMWDHSRILVSLPVMCFGFCAHVVMLPIVRPMRHLTLRRARVAVRRSLAVCASLYWSVGALAYASFRDRTAGDLLRNFGGGGGTASLVMYAVKLGYGFSIVCTVPMLLLPLRDTVTQLVSPTAPSAAALPSLHFQGLTAMILVTGLLIAGAVPNVEFVFGLTGATTCVILAFIVPAFIFLRHSAVLATGAGPARGPLLVARGDRRWRWLAWTSAPRFEQTAACMLIALGVIAAVGGVRATLGAVSEEAAVVSLAQDLAEMAIKTEAAQASMDDLQAHTSNLLTLREVVGSLGKAQTDAMEVLGQVETAVKTMDSMERRASTITHQMNRLDTFRRTATLPLHDTTTTLAEARSQVNRSYYEVLKAAQVLDQASVKDVKEQEASVPVVMTQPSVNQTTVPDGPPPAGEITPPPVDAKERHAEPADEQTSMQVGGSPLDPADGANEPFAQPSNQTDEPEEGAAPPLVSHASGEAKEKEQQQWLAKITEMRDKVNETLSALQNTAAALDELGSEADRLSEERKPRVFAAHISGMSAAMEGVMNASASAAVALNGTMSLAAMVEQEQDIAVREALREATDGLVGMQSELESVEFKKRTESKQTEIEAQASEGERNPGMRPEESSDNPPAVDAADARSTVPPDTIAATKSDLVEAALNATTSVLETIATWEQKATDGDEAQAPPAPPLNTTDVVATTAALAEALSSQKTALLSAKLEAAHPRVAARAEMIAKDLEGLKAPPQPEDNSPPPEAGPPLEDQAELGGEQMRADGQTAEGIDGAEPPELEDNDPRRLELP